MNETISFSSCGENVGKILYKNGLQVSVGHLRVPGAEILLWQTFWLNPTTGEPEPRPIYEVLSSHSARKAFAGNMYKNVKDPNLVCALTGHMMPEPERYIKEAEERGDIIIGMTNLPSHFRMGMGHVQGFKHIRLALGMHPQLVSPDTIREMTLFKELVDQTSYIGEIGLDFSRAFRPNRDMQIDCLRQILAIIKGKNKIISVHSRRAEKELLELLTEYETRNVIFHWYSGPLTLIDQILEKGYYFSINEAMCLSKNESKIIQAVPKDRILLESDAPFNDRCSLENVRARVGLEEKQLNTNFKQLISRLRIPER